MRDVVWYSVLVGFSVFGLAKTEHPVVRIILTLYGASMAGAVAVSVADLIEAAWLAWFMVAISAIISAIIAQRRGGGWRTDLALWAVIAGLSGALVHKLTSNWIFVSGLCLTVTVITVFLCCCRPEES